MKSAELNGQPNSGPPTTAEPERMSDLEAALEGSEESTEPAAEDATDPGHGAEPPLVVRRWGRRLVAVGIAVAFLAVLTLAGWLGWQYKGMRDTAEAGRQALDAAQRYALTLTKIDPGTIDQNFADALNGSTGEFKDMYSQSSAQLRQLLLDNKAVGHGTVVDAGIKSASRNKVEVVLFVDQAVTNAANPQPRIDRSRIAMTMERVDGRWLTSKVELP